MLKIWRMENASLMKLQSCCLIGTRHLFWFLCRLCKQKPMTVFCRYPSLLFTFGYCKPQFQGLITHSHSHFFFPWPAVLVFMKTLLKEWPGCTYYCHAKSTETCLHWSLPKVSRKNGSQHTSVKDNLETFSEGLAGVFGALCLSPGFQMAPSSNLGSAGTGLLWFTPKTEATPQTSQRQPWSRMALWGCTAFSGTHEPWEMTGVIAPHLLGWDICYFIPSRNGLVEELTQRSPVCYVIPLVSLGSAEAPALFVLSVSRACRELLVFYWASVVSGIFRIYMDPA